jgi:hypothetical protein
VVIVVKDGYLVTSPVMKEFMELRITDHDLIHCPSVSNNVRLFVIPIVAVLDLAGRLNAAYTSMEIV